MSVRDGQIRNDHLYLTSDIALAAYLLMRGYELLGALDTGSKRKEFGLTSTDPHVLVNMDADIAAKADEFEHMHLEIPHDKGAKVNFKLYHSRIKELHRALDDAIRKD